MNIGNVAGQKDSLEVLQGHSLPLQLPEAAETVAIGDPGIVQAVTVKPDLLVINATSAGTTSVTVFGKSGSIYQYTIKVNIDPALNALMMEKLANEYAGENSRILSREKIGMAVERLRFRHRNEMADAKLAILKPAIQATEKNVTVENLNGVILLRGTVATAAAHARVLSIADRVMKDEMKTPEEPDFRVITDHGGILAGNLDEKEQFEPVQPKLETQSLGGSSRGGRGSRRSNISNALKQPLMDGKGNLAQNLGRADVVMVADGRVISLIKVEKQPKVEIQMRIVAVDRAKTDELGIDWRLDDNKGKILIGSRLGAVTTSLPSPKDTAPINPGDSTLLGLFAPGKYFISAFLRAVEEKGAATTLSEPLLTAVSGESASFLVGGSLPIPLQELSPGNATSNAVVATFIEWIEFGLRLIVRPTVLENGKISIVLDQSISEPDSANQIQVLGAPIPGFKQKTVSTITESESGETWAVAGLLSEEQSKSLKSVPWISKVPILGALFRNKNDKISRNELMILVTARTIEGASQTTTNFDGEGRLGLTDPPLLSGDHKDGRSKNRHGNEPAKPALGYPARKIKPPANPPGSKTSHSYGQAPDGIEVLGPGSL